MQYELPEGYSLAKSEFGGYELPPGYSIAWQSPSTDVSAPSSNPSFEVAGATPTQSPQVMAQGNSFGGIPSARDMGNGLDISPARALLTNKPTSGLAEDFLRGLPAGAGAALGASAGAGVASIPLAALGAGSFEAGRQALAQAYSAGFGEPYTPPGQVIKNVGLQAAGGALGQGVAVGAEAAAPYAQKIAGQLLRIGPAVKEKIGTAVAADPSILTRGMPKEAV